MKSLRIIYMGTPAFALGPLKHIHNSPHKIVSVITTPDRKSGRGKQLTPSPVKSFSEEVGLPVLQPTNLKDIDFLLHLEALKPDVIVVVAFRMLPKEVWSIPLYGTFNLHASLLPQYRGAAPIQWAIINGEKETGVTTFFIDEKIDTGKIILQKKITIHEKETTGSLSNKLEEIGRHLVLETLNAIASKIVMTKPQPEKEHLQAAPKLTRDNTQINWNQSGRSIERLVRGLQPTPCAWTLLTNKEKTVRCKIITVEFHHGPKNDEIGKISVKNKQLFVQVSDGEIHVTRLQLPNKKSLSDSELVNGYAFDDDAKFEN